ncbi:hypothetical protein ACOME3_001011 [Neoechinorhynchus agilis]
MSPSKLKSQLPPIDRSSEVPILPIEQQTIRKCDPETPQIPSLIPTQKHQTKSLSNPRCSFRPCDEDVKLKSWTMPNFKSTRRSLQIEREQSKKIVLPLPAKVIPSTEMPMRFKVGISWVPSMSKENSFVKTVKSQNSPNNRSDPPISNELLQSQSKKIQLPIPKKSLSPSVKHLNKPDLPRSKNQVFTMPKPKKPTKKEISVEDPNIRSNDRFGAVPFRQPRCPHPQTNRYRAPFNQTQPRMGVFSFPGKGQQRMQLPMKPELSPPTYMPHLVMMPCCLNETFKFDPRCPTPLMVMVPSYVIPSTMTNALSPLYSINPGSSDVNQQPTKSRRRRRRRRRGHNNIPQQN